MTAHNLVKHMSENTHIISASHRDINQPGSGGRQQQLQRAIVFLCLHLHDQKAHLKTGRGSCIGAI